jgi:hypothetical protein
MIATLQHTTPKQGDSCAFYGRVSTKKQKLEHQREFVDRFLDQEGIHISPDLYFEDKEKRHKSAERENFQQLLEIARSGRIEWIIIASFERWGVADVDEFFDFRRQLKDAGVRLWSVQDQLDLTGCHDTDYFRIVALAVAHTMAMAQYAEQNIRKMVSMALAGWHATKEHPYGTDLICCQLNDKQELFRVQLESKALERKGPRIYKIVHVDGRTETVNKMPPRDCKSTGYRLAPSADPERIENVKLVFELYDQGLTYREISNRLWTMGRKYFGKLFGDHAIDAILKNPAYIGQPAWGKIAVGQYRQVFDKIAQKPTAKKKDQPRSFDKGEEHYVFSTEAVFDPETFISSKLWERVQAKLRGKPKREYSSRRRSKTIHPLNGLLVCPDCGRRMVVNNTTDRKGQLIHYFICGGYSKSGKVVCRPNSVRFTKVDEAMRICWERVSDALGDIAKLKQQDLSLEQLLGSNLEDSGKIIASILFDELGLDLSQIPDDAYKVAPKEFQHALALAFKAYRIKNKESTAHAAKRLKTIGTEINRIGDLLEKTPSDTLRQRWFGKLQELEAEKAKIEASCVSLVDKLKALVAHSEALAKTLGDTKSLQSAAMWDTFLEKVIPVMEDLPFGKKTQRTAIAFKFVPKSSVTDMVGGVLDITPARKGRDSALRSI